MLIHAPNEQVPFQKYDIAIEHDPSVDALAIFHGHIFCYVKLPEGYHFQGSDSW